MTTTIQYTEYSEPLGQLHRKTTAFYDFAKTLQECSMQARPSAAHQYIPGALAGERSFRDLESDRLMLSIKAATMAVLDVRIPRQDDGMRQHGYFLSFLDEISKRFNYALHHLITPDEAYQDVRVILPFDMPMELSQWASLSRVLIAASGATPNSRDVDRVLELPYANGAQQPLVSTLDNQANITKQAIRHLDQRFRHADYPYSTQYINAYESLGFYKSDHKYKFFSVNTQYDDFQLERLDEKVLPNDLNQAITWLKRDPTTISLLRERLRENITSEQFLIGMAQEHLNNYSPNHFTRNHYTALVDDVTEGIAEFKQDGLQQRISEIYNAALMYWLTNNPEFTQKREHQPNTEPESPEKHSNNLVRSKQRCQL